MSQARSELAVFALEGCVYAAGGHDGDDFLSTVEKYEPACDRWSAAPSMSVPRIDFKTMAWKVDEDVLDEMIRRALQSRR